MPTSFKKKSLLEGSGMIKQTEEYMEKVAAGTTDERLQPTTEEQKPAQQPVDQSVPKPANTVSMVHVQTQIPRTMKRILNNMVEDIRDSGDKTATLQKLVAQAIAEYIERHR